MAEEKKEKIVYISTYGAEDPERASLPFVLANGALVMEVEAVMMLQGPAVFLAKKGMLEHVHAAGLAPLKELVDSFLELGGRLLVCVPCILERKLNETDLIDQATPTGAGALTEEFLNANATLVY